MFECDVCNGDCAAADVRPLRCPYGCIDSLAAENAKLRKQLAEVHTHLAYAPIDYANGVEHSGMDEGNVLGWQRHNELLEKIEALLGQNIIPPMQGATNNDI